MTKGPTPFQLFNANSRNTGIDNKFLLVHSDEPNLNVGPIVVVNGRHLYRYANIRHAFTARLRIDRSTALFDGLVFNLKGHLTHRFIGNSIDRVCYVGTNTMSRVVTTPLTVDMLGFQTQFSKIME